MLTGGPLFQETTVTLLLQRHAVWQTPSIRQARPAISADLADMIECCLSREPQQRAPDFHELETWAAPIDPGLITPSDSDSLGSESEETIYY